MLILKNRLLILNRPLIFQLKIILFHLSSWKDFLAKFSFNFENFCENFSLLCVHVWTFFFLQKWNFFLLCHNSKLKWSYQKVSKNPEFKYLLLVETVQPKTYVYVLVPSLICKRSGIPLPGILLKLGIFLILVVTSW